jgi:hypothetical protein
VGKVTRKTIRGLLPATVTALYTVPGATRATVATISIENGGVGGELIHLYLQPAGETGTSLATKTLAAGHTLYPMTPLFMSAGSALTGDAADADTVSYLISIEEEVT